MLENHFEEIFTFNPVVDEAERLYKQTARYEAQFPQTEIQIADLSKLTTEELISNILGNQ